VINSEPEPTSPLEHLCRRPATRSTAADEGIACLSVRAHMRNYEEKKRDLKDAKEQLKLEQKMILTNVNTMHMAKLRMMGPAVTSHLSARDEARRRDVELWDEAARSRLARRQRMKPVVETVYVAHEEAELTEQMMASETAQAAATAAKAAAEEADLRAKAEEDARAAEATAEDAAGEAAEGVAAQAHTWSFTYSDTHRQMAMARRALKRVATSEAAPLEASQERHIASPCMPVPLSVHSRLCIHARNKQIAEQVRQETRALKQRVEDERRRLALRRQPRRPAAHRVEITADRQGGWSPREAVVSRPSASKPMAVASRVASMAMPTELTRGRRRRWSSDEAESKDLEKRCLELTGSTHEHSHEQRIRTQRQEQHRRTASMTALRLKEDDRTRAYKLRSSSRARADSSSTPRASKAARMVLVLSGGRTPRQYSVQERRLVPGLSLEGGATCSDSDTDLASSVTSTAADGLCKC